LRDVIEQFEKECFAPDLEVTRAAEVAPDQPRDYPMNFFQGGTRSHHRGLKAVVTVKRKQKKVIARGRTQAIDKVGKEAYHERANLGSTLFCPDRDVRIPYDQDLSGAELIWAFSGVKPQHSVERDYQSEAALSPLRRRPAIPVGKNMRLYAKRKLTV
jgi:hypothetical protein